MGNQLKRRFALAGLSSRCYTVEDMEMVDQFRETAKYKKWKKEFKTKSKDRKKNNKDSDWDGKPSYMKLKVISEPRLRI